MPIAIPSLDDRRYQDLLDESLARVPVHTPEWTNFNKSDPGVTVVELFAFLTENLIFRANQIPDRNRRKFLQLLGVGLLPASSAQGLVAINNDKGPLDTVTLPGNLEVRAGSVPYRTSSGLDVLPVEMKVYLKRRAPAPSAQLLQYYALLYASYGTTMPTDPELYETAPLDDKAAQAVSLADDVVDRSLWIGLFARRNETADDARAKIGGRVLSLGMVPAIDETAARLTPAGTANVEDEPALIFELPDVPADGKVQKDASSEPNPSYKRITPRGDADVLAQPGVVQLPLPPANELALWQDLDPLESGVGELPPAIDDDKLAARLITWIRVRCTVASRARFLWVGGNTVRVEQRARVAAEPLGEGNGQPDQARRLAKAPVLADSVSVQVVTAQPGDPWLPIDDLLAAGPEIAVENLRKPPGVAPPPPAPADRFALDAESGEIRFGDGLHGRRPPDGARLFATYDFSVGAQGNVAKGAINAGPTLPSGFTVSNPVRTWGGADAEEVAEGEKQVRRYLQHRDRLVTAADFEAIAYRAPGLDIGRVEVLPAFHPDLSPNEPGGAPGVVTLLVIPGHDVDQPDAPLPDRLFLDTLCAYLDPRRLVTTELILAGPDYKAIWVSIGIDVVAGSSIAEVVDAVKSRIRDALAPVRKVGLPETTDLLTTPSSAAADRGWPLRTAVSARMLAAEAARVPGVSSVSDVVLAEGDKAADTSIGMQALELPRLMGISVVVGDPEDIDALRGQAVVTSDTGKRRLPVPFVPQEC